MSRCRIVNSTCAEFLYGRPDVRFDCVFADPPDNIGLKYNRHKDKMSSDEYLTMLEVDLTLFVSTAPVVWLSFNSRWMLEVAAIVSDITRHLQHMEVKPCVQTFTFAQHNPKDLCNSHRPLWRIMWKSAKLYPDQIRVPSWRQLNGDKRAAEGGRVPGDVFAFPRVTGNSKQRRSWHPTQLHEGLVERCIKLSTREGDTVLDAYAGTGTTMRVCRGINRNCVSVEKDALYCEKIAEEFGLPLTRCDYIRDLYQV